MADFSRAFLVNSADRKYKIKKKSQEQAFCPYFHDFQSVGWSGEKKEEEEEEEVNRHILSVSFYSNYVKPDLPLQNWLYLG